MAFIDQRAFLRLLAAALAILAVNRPDALRGAGPRYRIEIAGGEVDAVNVPLVVQVPYPERWPLHHTITLAGANGLTIAGQAHAASRAAAGPRGAVDVHFVVPKLPARVTQTWELWIDRDSTFDPLRGGGFQWADTRGEYADLVWAQPVESSRPARPVLRYMYASLDESTPQRREETYKPYHHVFSPDGRTLVTKGPGGKYPHHRGLFFGFNRVTYGDDKKADVWHCKGGAYQSHELVDQQWAGPVFAGQKVTIAWHGREREVFAHEARRVTVYATAGGTLIEFESEVTPAVAKVRLDGDPQHAGFHFRAAQEVAESTAGQTYYLRPDGPGQPGETRNWPDQKDHVNLPWNAMSFVVGGNRYTALYLDHPDNPKEARYSERDYGRFGSYFEYDLTAEQPLRVRYRVWLQEGEMTVEQAAAYSAAFTAPPKVTAAPL